MKTIYFFVASSAELKCERMEFVDLMQDMNDELEGHNIKLKPVLWEYMDSSMRAERKEDEYLVKLRECEVCIVLFWKTLGEYTLEELEVAVSEKSTLQKPRYIYVLFKEPSETTTEELQSFKLRFQHYYKGIPYCTFTNVKMFRQIITNIFKQVLEI